MPFPLLEASPLYENEDLKEGSIPTVTPIEQVRDEGNCGEVTNRGEEACECADKLTNLRPREISVTDHRRQPHSRQEPRGYEQKRHRGREESEVSWLETTKPFPTEPCGR